MKRFKSIVAIVLACGMLFMSACETDGTGTAQGSAADTGDIVSEDYYYVYQQEITTLNYLSTNKSVDSDAIATLLDPLVLLNKFGDFEPGMALSWEQSEDGLTWTFNIRPGIQWQRWDGSFYGAEVTAHDWVSGIEYILDPDFASFTVDFVLEFIENAQAYYDGECDFSEVGVKAIDDYTLEYTTSRIVPFFPSVLTYTCFLPINSDFVDEIGGIDAFGSDNDKLLGYGEYLFETWERDSQWVFVKNPEYYLADRVHVNKRSYVQVTDVRVALEMYKRGEVTAATVVTDQVDAVLADPELAPYAYVARLTASSWAYYFNYTSPNTNFVTAVNNTNFRKAIMAAFDRTTILSASNRFIPDQIRRNTINVWGLSFDENGRDYMSYGGLQDIEARDSFNLDLAAEYLALAKEELGDTVTWPVSIRLFSTDSATNTQIAELIKQVLEANLGKDTVSIEFALCSSTVYYQKQEEGDYDMASGGWSPDYADPSNYLDIYTSTGYIGSRIGFALCDDIAEYDALIKEGKSKTVLSEAYECYAAAETYLIENAIVIPHRATGGNYAINNNLRPYDSLQNNHYGLATSMWKDIVYGKTPLTVEERAAQKLEFEAERDSRNN